MKASSKERLHVVSLGGVVGALCDAALERHARCVAWGADGSTQTAMAVEALQLALPSARVLYSSATGATDATHLVRGGGLPGQAHPYRTACSMQHVPAGMPPTDILQRSIVTTSTLCSRFGTLPALTDKDIRTQRGVAWRGVVCRSLASGCTRAAAGS